MYPRSLPGDWEMNYIDGRRRRPEQRDSIDIRNPYDGSHVATVPAGTKSDVEIAIDAATDAQDAWGERAPESRARLLQRTADILSEMDVSSLLSSERGLTERQTRIEAGSTAVALLENAADIATAVGTDGCGVRTGRRRRPRGVIGVITPWTMPFYRSIRVTAVALAMGNTVVLKPAEQTPICGGLLISELFDAADAPPGVVNVVPGTGSEAGDALVRRPELSVLSFGGSSDIARSIAATCGTELTHPVLNLSGNNPHVVCAGADIENALDVACDGSFRYHGQVELSMNRHYVHESIRAEYVEGLVSRAEALTVGDPTQALTDVGPMIMDGLRETTSTYIEQSRDEGATVRIGGEHDSSVLEPTVLSDVENGMPVAENETFGPIAPVLAFEDVDELYELVTTHPFGNVLSVHTETVERGRRIADGIDRHRTETSIGQTDIHVNPSPISDDGKIDGTRAHFFDKYDECTWANRVTRSTWQTVSHQS